MATTLAPTARYMDLLVGKRIFKVRTLAEASRAYQEERDRRMLATKRASRMPDGMIYDGETFVARVSYNGRVWANREWTPNETPIMDAA